MSARETCEWFAGGCRFVVDRYVHLALDDPLGGWWLWGAIRSDDRLEPIGRQLPTWSTVIERAWQFAERGDSRPAAAPAWSAAGPSLVPGTKPTGHQP